MAKILILDIETSPCVAYVWGLYKENIGIEQIIKPSQIICWSAKWYGSKNVMFGSIKQSSHKKMLENLFALMDQADIIVHFNGRAFDIKTINKDFISNRIAPPSPYRQIDLIETAKYSFNFQSNKLNFITQQLGIGSKIQHEGFQLWKKCLDGNKEAWNTMKKYNIQDVILTEKLYVKLRPWIHNHPNLSILDAKPDSCPNCGAIGTLISRGTRILCGKTLYHRYQCAITKNRGGCGSWIKGGKVVQ